MSNPADIGKAAFSAARVVSRAPGRGNVVDKRGRNLHLGGAVGARGNGEFRSDSEGGHETGAAV